MSGAVAAGLDALAERYGLPDVARARLAQLLDALVEDPLAPTSVRDPVRALNDHLADALVALDLEEVRTARSLADLGAGAGVPGLPLAIARPDLAVVLVEAAGRKCAFMARVADALHLANVEVVHARAEELAAQRPDHFDLVTARAVSSLAVVAEYAAPLLALGGTLVAWRGARDIQAEIEAQSAALELGLSVREPVPVFPYLAAERRHLHLMSKVALTPARFPRRPGMAAKRPLGRG